MPNIKSQKKRSITNLKRNAAKTAEKSALKTAIKEVLVAVEAKDKEKAVPLSTPGGGSHGGTDIWPI